MNLKDIQVDPLLAVMYEYDKWSQLARTGSPNRADYTLSLDMSSPFRDSALCEHFVCENPWDRCKPCTKFMQWTACPEYDSLFTKWLNSETLTDRSYYAERIAHECIEAAIRYIDEYEEY